MSDDIEQLVMRMRLMADDLRAASGEMESLHIQLLLSESLRINWQRRCERLQQQLAESA